MRNGMTVHQSVAEDWRITLVETGLETQTGGRLKRVARYLGDDPLFCMTYGDAVADIDIAREIAFHKNHGKLATVGRCSRARGSALWRSKGRGSAISRKSRVREGGLINGGFFVLSPKVLDLIEGDAMPWESMPLQTLAREGDLMAFRHEGFWRPMDTLRDRLDLEAIWETGRAPWKLWPDPAS